MQQLCLTGAHAADLADRLFSALNVRPVGLRIAPFAAQGRILGDAAHLTPPPAPPLLNGVPCRVRITPEQSSVVPQALEETAAPGLLAAMRLHAPLLISGLSADVLACGPFREAVRTCLMGAGPVVITADKAAAARLQQLTPPERQLWFDVPEDEAGQTALLESLLPEAALRF